MENVENVLITAEVAKLLDYETVHVIRVAKELLNQGIITEKDFRSAGLRTYLFNQEALKQLRIKFDNPTYFLTYEMDEDPYQIRQLSYSELRVGGEDLIILNDESEKAKFQALRQAFDDEQEGAEAAYEEYLGEKDYLHEYVAYDDNDGWVSYVKLDQAIREGKAYFIENSELVKVQAKDVEKLAITDKTQLISSPVVKICEDIFKAPSGEYYRFTGNGFEVEEIDMDDERIKYWTMSEQEALDQIAKDFNLEYRYEKVEYWDNQPVFWSKDGQKIEIKEMVIGNGMAHLKTRNLSEILDDVMGL